MGKHFEFDLKLLEDFNDLPMRTYYEVIDAKGDIGLTLEKRSCFAQAHSFIEDGGRKTGHTLVKYFMWSNATGNKDSDRTKAHFAVAERFLETVMKIPFVQDRVIEFTGINKAKGETGYYVLVDLSENQDEGFVTLQLFRLAQEMLGHMETYAKVLEETDNEFLAFALACQYSNCEGTPRTNGHIPTNNFNLLWWDDFIKDPSIARSGGTGWNSTVLCPTSRQPYLNFDNAKNALTKGDIPKHLVLVYGTLRQGNGNHRIISEAQKAQAATYLSDRWIHLLARMYDTGSGFPALVPDLRGAEIHVEAYHVNDDTFARLDRLEGYPHMYNRVQVEYAGEPAWVYIQRSAQGYKLIPKGDWNEYVQSR